MKVIQDPGIGPNEGFVVDQVTEDLTVSDERERFLALPGRGGHQVLLQAVNHLDGASLFVNALVIAGPARHNGRGAVDPPILFQVDADDRQKPLGDPVGAFGAQPGQGVPDVLVGEPLDQGALVFVEVDAGDRLEGGGGRPTTRQRL
jgi:hypothetical protein